jgi:hypothetical protein
MIKIKTRVFFGRCVGVTDIQNTAGKKKTRNGIGVSELCSCHGK